MTPVSPPTDGVSEPAVERSEGQREHEDQRHRLSKGEEEGQGKEGQGEAQSRHQNPKER